MRFVFLCLISCLLAGVSAFGARAESTPPFPRPLDSYSTPSGGVLEILKARAAAEPLNVAATAIFFLAIVHTFLASRFTHIAHRWRDEHAQRAAADKEVSTVSFRAEVMHFVGEVEAVFGIWAVPLLLIITLDKGWPSAKEYVAHGVNFTEPMFIVVIMALASTRPILRFAEQCLSLLAGLGKSTPGAWWISILTAGPLLGSLITEPAAMTICALLLGQQFYDLKPSPRLCYATLGLLFVNISIGGTLTHFAAPPVLMVAAKWNWNSAFMLANFGWKAVFAIAISTAIYFAAFCREIGALSRLQQSAAPDSQRPIPAWITGTHLAFLGWTVFTAHYPALFIGGFLFFLAFTIATEPHQTPLKMKPPLLVGFFLAGLVIHGGLQAWWIEPVLASLSATALLLGGMALTAVNDNAAITYLATLVPSFDAAMKYAIVAGAVAGGGLTVIANAPNPAGQSILARYFEDGVSPLKLLLGALIPTAVAVLCFLLL